MAKNKHHEHNFLKLLGLLLLVAGLCFGGLVAWRHFNGKDPFQPETEEITEPVAKNESSDVLEDEKSGETTEGDDNKAEAVKDENSRDEIKKDKDGLKVATITLAAGYEDGVATVHGSITNIVEEGGSCTYTLSGPNGKAVIKKTDTITDFHSTLCQAVEFSKDELGAGTWKASLKYKSNTAEGESETKTISIQ